MKGLTLPTHAHIFVPHIVGLAFLWQTHQEILHQHQRYSSVPET